MNRALLLAAAFFLACAAGYSQDQQAPNDSDVDNMFNGGSSTQTDVQPPPSGQTTPPAQNPASLRPDDILQDRKLHFFGSLDLYGDIGGGWSGPDITQLDRKPGRDFGGSLGTSLGFEIRPASELRIRASLGYSFPGSGQSALPQLTEVFFDYSLLEHVFFRIGIFDYTWGNSQFFLFGNLPARSQPGWTGSANLPFWERSNLLTNVTTQNYPVSFKMSVPIGLNTLTFLARFDLANYGFADPTSPNPMNGGYGLQLDLVTGPIEWSLGGFFQRSLTPRTLLSMKTSMLGFDLSAEVTAAYLFTSSITGISAAGGGIPVGGDLQRIYPTAVVGIAREWQEPRIRLYAEYGFNGERDLGMSWIADASGPAGHNTALGIRWTDLGQTGITVNLLWQQNWSDRSGLAAAFVEFAPVSPVTIQVGLPVVYISGEASANRLVPGSQSVGLLVLVKLSSSFRQ